MHAVGISKSLKTIQDLLFLSTVGIRPAGVHLPHAAILPLVPSFLYKLKYIHPMFKDKRKKNEEARLIK